MNTRHFPKILTASISLLVLATTARAADGTKSNNADDLNLSTSWIGGIAPDTSGIATFDETLSAAQTYAIGDNLSWGGIRVTNVGGVQTIAGTAGKRLTIGSSGIDLSGATANLTVGADLVLGAAQDWAIGSGRNLTLTGVISGAASAGISKTGAGSVTLSGASTFGGNLSIVQGNITLGANGAIPSSTVVTIGGTGTSQLVLNGFNQTIGGINIATGGTRRVIGNSATLSTLTINTAAGTTYSFGGQVGQVSGNANQNRLAVIKTGAGLQDFTNTTNVVYTGNTTIQDGALGFAVGNGPLASFVSLDGGVFQSLGTTPLAFTRSLGTSGATAFQWTANGGGFSAKDANLTVNIGGNSDILNWGSSVGSTIVGTLRFGHATANAVTDFQNGINLNGANRAISVADNLSTAADFATISGVIANGTGTAGIIKTGPGTLVLSGLNSYTGPTTIQEGALAFGVENTIANSPLVLDGGVLQNQTSIPLTFTRSLGTTGGNSIQWTANGGGFSANAAKLTVNIGGAGQTLNWGSNVGTELTGTLKFGHSDASAETELQNGINLNGAVRTVDVTNNTATTLDFATISGAIADGSAPGGLVKAGQGTLVLSGNNTYTGTTSVNEGVLIAPSSANLPGARTSGKVNVQSGATLQVRTGGATEWSLNDAVSLLGTVAFQQGATLTLETTADTVLNIPLAASNARLGKAGLGTLLITGANTFTGGTLASEGTIQLGTNTSLGSGAITLAGGAISSSDNTARTLANPIVVQRVSTVGNATNNGAITLTGSIDFSAAPRNLNIESDVTILGTSSNGGLGQKTGPGTLTIKGNGDWTAGGATEVRDGVLVLDGATIVNDDSLRIVASVPNGTARLDIRNGSSFTITRTTANFRIGYNPGGDPSATNIADIAGSLILPASGTGGAVQLGTYSAKAILNLKPGGLIATKTINTGSSAGETEANFDGGTLKALAASATFIQNLTHAYIQSGGLVVDSNGFDLTVPQSLEHDPLLGAQRDGGLTKNGAGSVALGGINTFDGPTTVNQGTLLVTGSISGSSVNVNNGATLGGFGNISLSSGSSLNVAAGGSLSPGLGIGSLIVTADGGQLNLAAAVQGIATGALQYELGPSGQNDILTLSGGAFNIGSGVLAFDDFTFSDAGGLGLGTYTLFDSNSPIIGQLDLAHSSGKIGDYIGTLSLANGSNDLVLTVVPEPNVGMLLLGSVGALLGLRRRSRA